MFIDKISATYERKVNTGNYSSATVAITMWADLDHGDDPAQCMEALRGMAREHVDGACRGLAGGGDVPPSPVPLEPRSAKEDEAQRKATNHQRPKDTAGDLPRTGPALYAWARDKGQAHRVDFLGHLDGWARDQAITADMAVWTADLVKRAVEEVLREWTKVRAERAAKAS